MKKIYAICFVWLVMGIGIMALSFTLIYSSTKDIFVANNSTKTAIGTISSCENNHTNYEFETADGKLVQGSFIGVNRLELPVNSQISILYDTKDADISYIKNLNILHREYQIYVYIAFAIICMAIGGISECTACIRSVKSKIHNETNIDTVEDNLNKQLNKPNNKFLANSILIMSVVVFLSGVAMFFIGNYDNITTPLFICFGAVNFFLYSVFLRNK